MMTELVEAGEIGRVSDVKILLLLRVGLQTKPETEAYLYENVCIEWGISKSTQIYIDVCIHMHAVEFLWCPRLGVVRVTLMAK